MTSLGQYVRERFATMSVEELIGQSAPTPEQKGLAFKGRFCEMCGIPLRSVQAATRGKVLQCLQA